MSSLPLRLLNKTFAQYLHWRMPRIDRTRRNPDEFQDRWMEYLLTHARNTSFGEDHKLKDVRTYEQFRKQVPIRDYDGHVGYINRMLAGERNVLWPGFVHWFSKSSGTSSDRSKYIPVTGENLRKNHIRGCWDAMSLYYHQRPKAGLFSRKNLIMGGCIQERRPSGAKIGDISGIMLANFPSVGRPFYTPSFDTMLMQDYEKKLEAVARESMVEDVGMVGGVPNWTMLLMRRILELTGAANMREVWPNFELFTHGGISFAPYRQQFEKLIGPNPINYQEIYNASEGYFGLRDDLTRDDMLLLVDNGVFYEFLPRDQWDVEHPQAIPLNEVKMGVTYGVVVTTNAGLWRYNLGDTIKFTSIRPFRFHITGRTKQFINTFGEEIMVNNTDRALTMTCADLNCTVTEYTVAPVFINKPGERGAHEWCVEFGRPPRSLSAFAKTLDKHLQNVNGDYAAKRKSDMVLTEILVNVVAPGTFHGYMKKQGKLGGQGKVPRLSTSRTYLAEILRFGQVSQRHTPIITA